MSIDAIFWFCIVNWHYYGWSIWQTNVNQQTFRLSDCQSTMWDYCILSIDIGSRFQCFLVFSLRLVRVSDLIVVFLQLLLEVAKRIDWSSVHSPVVLQLTCSPLDTTHHRSTSVLIDLPSVAARRRCFGWRFGRALARQCAVHICTRQRSTLLFHML